MKDPYTPGHGSVDFRVTRYDLELDYRPATNALDGRGTLFVEVLEDLDALSFDLVGLGVDKVGVRGRGPVRWRHRDGRLTVTLGETVAEGSTLVVEVRWSGQPGPARGPWGDVGWEELTDGVLVAGQPDGAPTWFPCNDSPADKASFRLTVRTESAYHVAANGVLVSRRASGSRTTWVYEQSEPMAVYLATLQIGRYEEHRLAAAPVPQSFLAPTRLVARAWHDLGRQVEMTAVFCRLFGPYPFPGYTSVVTDDDLEIPLEAQGLSVFGANHVDGARRSERLVAHELAHQWFGNSLTVAAWRHLWLNEGFACYAEWLWSQESGGQSTASLARAAHKRLAGLPQDLLLSDPGPELMFDDRLYKRGALTLHALRTLCGDDVFFGLLQDWTARHRHGSVTTELFVSHAVRHAGPDAADLLSDWLDGTALPPLT